MTNVFYPVLIAAEIARELHAGQTDKAGVDYFFGHLSYVSSLGEDWREQVLGYLHDAIEDTDIDLDKLMRRFRDECEAYLIEHPNVPIVETSEYLAIEEALALLNRAAVPDRRTYIRKISTNLLATRVKMYDLRHNLNLGRFAVPTQRDLDRAARYAEELRYLWMKEKLLRHGEDDF